MAAMIREKLGFKYVRKRIKKEIKLPPLCPDYEIKGSYDGCLKARFCKNASYGWKDEAIGSCYGGTKGSEREDRGKKLKLRTD